MKILLVYPAFHSSADTVSGESTYYKNMMSAMRGRGFEVECCEVGRPPHASVGGKFDRYTRAISAFNTARELGRRSYDLVHFLNASLAVGGTLIKKPKIANAHFSAESYFALTRPEGWFKRTAEAIFCQYTTLLDRRAFRDLDCLVAGSPYLEGCTRSLYGLDNTQVIHPGIDTRALRETPGIDLNSRYGTERTVLFLGRLHERSKGISYLIRAMKHVRRGMKLILVGDGPDKKAYEALCRKLGISERVIFLGRLGWEEKYSIQKSADVAAIPTLYDTVSMYFSECLACDVPVVSFDMPFWKGLYDDAALFVEKDPVSLARGIEMLADDSGLRKRLTARGRRYAEEYDVEKCVSRHAALYQKALNRA